MDLMYYSEIASRFAEHERRLATLAAYTSAGVTLTIIFYSQSILLDSKESHMQLVRADLDGSSIKLSDCKKRLIGCINKGLSSFGRKSGATSMCSADGLDQVISGDIFE